MFNSIKEFKEKCDIKIVSHELRRPLITDYLDKLNLNYQVSNTPDYPYDGQYVVDSWNVMNCNPVGAYRAFRGHQKALSESYKPYTLVFEYDAVPLVNNWLDVLIQNSHHIDQTGLLFLHLRAEPVSYSHISSFGKIASDIAFGQVVGGITVKKGLGALAYMVDTPTRNEILKEKFTGVAYDILLTNDYKFRWLCEPDLFLHDDKQGSLTDGHK